MVTRGWGVLPVDLVTASNRATLPSPAGDHQGLPYGPSGLRPVFMASVDAYYRRCIGPLERCS